MSNHARVAVISAEWHSDLLDGAVSAFQDQIQINLPGCELTRFAVPGAFEIPLAAMRLAQSGEVDAIAACALVVDGGIYRHEFVAQTVVSALMQVQLTTDVPTFSAVLTPHHFHEHEEHTMYFARHLVKKGTELANAVAGTLQTLSTIPPSRDE